MWPAKSSTLTGVESRQLSPSSRGDLEPKRAKQSLGNMSLTDGAVAVLFDPPYGVDDLSTKLKHVIDVIAPNLVLGVCDRISSPCDVRRTEEVVAVSMNTTAAKEGVGGTNRRRPWFPR